MSSDFYRTFLIGRRNDGSRLRLDCLDSTAKFFGWDQELSFHHLPWEAPPPGAPRAYGADAVAFGTYGGRYMRISLSRSRQGAPKGQTKRFRVSVNTRLRDLAFLAAVTGPEFGWMTDMNGRRLFREEWLGYWSAYLSSTGLTPSDPA